MLLRLKVWNRWRKRNLNGLVYKILVLFGLAKSPTFEVEYNFARVDKPISCSVDPVLVNRIKECLSHEETNN